MEPLGPASGRPDGRFRPDPAAPCGLRFYVRAFLEKMRLHRSPPEAEVSQALTGPLRPRSNFRMSATAIRRPEPTLYRPLNSLAEKGVFRFAQNASRACTAPDIHISRACCAAGYRAAGANFSTKMHVGAAPGRSGGPRRSRFDLPDLSDVQACQPPVGRRRKADRAQEAPERQASAWSALGAAVSAAALDGGDRARAAEEPVTLPPGRTATAPHPENPLGGRPCSPAGGGLALPSGPPRARPGPG